MFRNSLNLPKLYLSKYNNALMRSPYKTKMATAGFTYFLADVICQNYIESKNQKPSLEDYSPIRSLRQGSVGAFFAAPSLHVWHSIILPKLVKSCANTYLRVCTSVLLNETLLASYFITMLLFSFESLKTLSFEEGVQNVQNKFVPAISSSVKFWTGISFINYGLMPIHLRPVFVSCWSVVWQSYLSYVSNNQINQKKESEDLVEYHMNSLEEMNVYESNILHQHVLMGAK